MERKGFTLVELLAVIVILAIIMIIAIPSVLSVMETAKRKAFMEFADKSSIESQKQLAHEQMAGKKNYESCYIYNIKNDIGIPSTGNYDGWILINPQENDIYMTLYDNDLVLIGYHYSDAQLDMNYHVEKRNSTNETKLTVEELASYSSCETYTYRDVEVEKVAKTADLAASYVVRQKIYSAASNNITNITSIKQTKDIKDATHLVSTDDSEFPIYVYVEDNILYFASKASKIYMNKDSQSILSGFTSATSIDVSRFDTSRVENIRNMFLNDYLVAELDLSGWSSARITRATSMFQNCKKLKKIIFSSEFTGSGINNFEYFFEHCDELEDLDISMFVPLSTVSTYAMFRNCAKLKNVKFGNFDLRVCTDMSLMFYMCTSLENIDLSTFKTPSVTSIWSMFSTCSSLKTVDFRNWDISKVIAASELFFGCQQLKKIYVNDSWNASNISSSSMMFKNIFAIEGAVPYDKDKVDKDMANYTTGYLTYKA